MSKKFKEHLLPDVLFYKRSLDNLTQRELAKELDVDHNLLSLIERGDYKPQKGETLDRILDYLNLKREVYFVEKCEDEFD